MPTNYIASTRIASERAKFLAFRRFLTLVLISITAASTSWAQPSPSDEGAVSAFQANVLPALDIP